MSLKLVNIDLSFSSTEESEQPALRLCLPSQLEPVVDSTLTSHYKKNKFSVQAHTRLSDSGRLKPRREELRKMTACYPHCKRIKFVKLDLAKLSIPQPVAPVSQLGLFDFPQSGAFKTKGDSVTSDERGTSNTIPILSKTVNSDSYPPNSNRTSNALFQQERSPGKQKKYNQEVVRKIKRLMNEIKLVRKRNYKESRCRINNICKLGVLRSERDLKIPWYLQSEI